MNQLKKNVLLFLSLFVMGSAHASSRESNIEEIIYNRRNIPYYLIFLYESVFLHRNSSDEIFLREKALREKLAVCDDKNLALLVDLNYFRNYIEIRKEEKNFEITGKDSKKMYYFMRIIKHMNGLCVYEKAGSSYFLYDQYVRSYIKDKHLWSLSIEELQCLNNENNFLRWMSKEKLGLYEPKPELSSKLEISSEAK